MPNRNIQLTFNQGYVSSRDKSELKPGELTSGVAAYYKPGDTKRIWKEPGRSLHHQFSGINPIKGLTLCTFDLSYDLVRPSGTDVKDKLFVFIDDRLEYVDPVDGAVSGIITSGLGTSGLVEDTQRLYNVHFDDKWYLGTAIERPYVIDINTTEYARKMGMLPPIVPVSTSLAGVATFTISPSGTTSGIDWWHWGYKQGNEKKFDRYRHKNATTNYIQPFVDTFKVWDGNPETYTYAEIGSTPDSSLDVESGWGINSRLADSLIRVAEFKDFPSESSSTERWLSIDWQVVAGTDDAGGSDVGVATSLGTLGAEIRIEAFFDGAIDGDKDFYLPHPRFDESDLANRMSLNYGGWRANKWYVPDERKAKRAVLAQVKTVMSDKQNITMSIPSEYNVSGMRIVCSIAPYGAEDNSGMSARINFQYPKPSPDDASINQVPTPSKRAMEPSVLRIYNMQVIDGTSSVLAGSDTISGVRYAFTEYDAIRELESVPGSQSPTLWFDDRVGTIVTIPSGLQNENATHYNIYRSNMGGVPFTSGKDDWSNYGRVGQVPVSSEAVEFIDTFEIPIFSIGLPTISTVDVVGSDSIPISKLRDFPPSKLKAMTNFKGSIVGTISENPRGLSYSYQGYPESFPKLNSIDALPLKENDVLVAPVALDNILVILARGTVMTLEEVPHFRAGLLVQSEVNVIEGAPGCVGDYAYTEMEFGNFPAVGYISIHGVYACDGHSSIRISEDLDWDLETNRATLKSSSLTYDRNLQHLIFLFDRSGDGQNDTKFIFHMDPVHRKDNGMPKVTGPTPVNLSKMISSQIQDEYFLFSADSTVNARLYKERDGLVDESGSYDAAISGVIPFNIMTGQLYFDWQYWSAVRGNLRHTNWGSEQMAMTWTAGRDDGQNTMSVSKTFSLNGHRGNEAFIGRRGEWHQCQITNLTSGMNGGLLHMNIKAQIDDTDSGDV